jgi:GAF domain-containing protein
VAYRADVDRYPSPTFRQYVEMGCRSICSVPLMTRDRPMGALALVRMTDDRWVPDDVEFLAQVASQIAIAVENSLTYRQLEELKERLGQQVSRRPLLQAACLSVARPAVTGTPGRHTAAHALLRSAARSPDGP